MLSSRIAMRPGLFLLPLVCGLSLALNLPGSAPLYAADDPPAPIPLEAPDAAPFLQTLNGEWQCAGPDSTDFKRVQVPGFWDQAAADRKTALDWPTATYRREITIPAGTAGACVEFDSITWGGEVLLNGHSLGTHDLGYAGCTFNLTPFLKEGANTLEVKPVGWKAIPRYPGGMTKIAVGAANWFGNRMGGIPGDVRLRLFNSACIEGFRVLPQVVGAVQPGCKLSIPIHAGARLLTGIVHVQILSDDGKTAVAAAWQKNIALAANGSASIESDLIPLPGATLWSPATPVLYRARVWLEMLGPGDATLVSVRDETFGLREITIKDNHLQINGNPVALFGYSGVGQYFNFDLMRDTPLLKKYQADNLRKLNGTAFRCHQNPLPRAWLDLCDRNGILVICEFNNFPDTQIQPTDTVENPYDRAEYWANFQREVTGLINDRFNHPSIVMWSATNEGNGFSDWERANLYPHVKKQDATRPVLFSSDITPDVADTHNFCGNWWALQSDFDRIESDLARTYSDRLFGCTEFGQYQFAANLYGEKARDKTHPPEYENDFAQMVLEEIETLRRLRAGLILPFVVPYRPETTGAPSPVFEAMRQAYAPLGLSLNRPQRHAVAGPAVKCPITVYSDAPDAAGQYTVMVSALTEHPGFGWDGNPDRKKLAAAALSFVTVEPWKTAQLDLTLNNLKPGAYTLAAVLIKTGAPEGTPALAVSFRPLTIYPALPVVARPLVVAVLESGTAISDWLTARGHTVVPLMTEKKPDVVVIGEGMLASGYLRMYQFMTLMRVKNGARIVILEQPNWSVEAFANDLLTGLQPVATRGGVEALFPDPAMEAQIGSAADFRRLNGLDGLALRTALQPPPPVLAALAPAEKIPTGQLPMPKETPASPATPAQPATPAVPLTPPPPAVGELPIPGSIPPASSPWKSWLSGYSHGLKRPDIAVAQRTWEKGEIIACQIPLETRLDAKRHAAEFDPVVERLFAHMIESARPELVPTNPTAPTATPHTP